MCPKFVSDENKANAAPDNLAKNKKHLMFFNEESRKSCRCLSPIGDDEAQHKLAVDDSSSANKNSTGFFSLVPPPASPAKDDGDIQELIGIFEKQGLTSPKKPKAIGSEVATLSKIRKPIPIRFLSDDVKNLQSEGDLYCRPTVNLF